MDLAGKLARFVMKRKFWGGFSDAPLVAANERGHVNSHFHARAIDDVRGARLLACFDTVPEAADRLPESTGCKPYYRLAEMLAEEAIEVVIEYTDGNGRRLMHICEKSIEMARDIGSRTITTGIVEKVIKQARFSFTWRILRHLTPRQIEVLQDRTAGNRHHGGGNSLDRGLEQRKVVPTRHGRDFSAQPASQPSFLDGYQAARLLD